MTRPLTLANRLVRLLSKEVRFWRNPSSVTRRVFSNSSKKNFVSIGDSDGDDDIIEIYDLPTEPQFEENPEFEYASQVSVECRYPFINNKRSSGGVFDLSEITQFLRTENLSDIVAIRLPKALSYGDFMVIATAKSRKHTEQVAKILQKLFKIKRTSSDPFPSFEGLENQSDWVVVDLGNIIVHIFSTVDCRERYDLESLWGIGPEFDEKTQGWEASQGEPNHSSPLAFTQADWERIVAEVNAEESQSSPMSKE